jgi:hypothetical protein
MRKKSNCSAACHFDERQRGEIQHNIEKDFSLPLEMTIENEQVERLQKN